MFSSQVVFQREPSAGRSAIVCLWCESPFRTSFVKKITKNLIEYMILIL